ALAAPGRFRRRDWLVGLLWPELDQAHARAALRKAVLEVRECFGAAALESRGDEELAFDTSALDCDALDFVRAAEQGHLNRALELYGGELMPGFHLNNASAFADWLDD